MPRTHLKAILPQIHQLFGSGTNIGMSDGVLLRRYCTSGDENAFTTLVARHGAMVLSVCQGVLRDESRAEDAFQAVWLVLVRRRGRFALTIRSAAGCTGWPIASQFGAGRHGQKAAARADGRGPRRCPGVRNSQV